MDRLVRLAVAALLAASGSIASLATAPRPAHAVTIDPCSGGFGYLVCVKLEIRSSTDYTRTPLTGSGTVTSDPPGIDCAFSPSGPDPATACYHYFKSSTQTSISVALTATPAAHSVAKCIEPFPPIQWYDTPCNKTVVLTGFQDYPVWDGFFLGTNTVTIGPSVGTVRSDPAGIDCGSGMPECAYAFPYGTALTLTASLVVPLPFQGWSGACAGQGPTCHITVTADVSTSPFWAPTPATPSPTGTPRPTPTPPPSARPSQTGLPGSTHVPPGSSGPATPAATTDGGSWPPAGPSQEPTEEPAASALDAQLPATVASQPGPPIDLGPVAIAIVAVGVLVSLAIVAAAWLRRSRPSAR